MKRKSLILLFISSFLILTAGCGYIKRLANRTDQNSAHLDIKDNLVKAEWGEYKIPEGWAFCEEYTSEQDMSVGKLFYKNREALNDPDIHTNISVEHGINRYPEDEHERFRDAVLKQLLSQIENNGAQLTGSGGYTDEGYILYTFIIEDDFEDITTVQHYIIGDKEYVLVHLTDYHEQKGEGAVDASDEFAQSVKWNYSETRH